MEYIILITIACVGSIAFGIYGITCEYRANKKMEIARDLVTQASAIVASLMQAVNEVNKK